MGVEDDPEGLPKLDFSTFVLSIIGSAFVHLGDAPAPFDGEDPEASSRGDAQAEPNLLLARQDIDLLELLQEKTKGNLDGEEERVLSQGLFDLRMRYVEVSKTK
ncbi:MAG TPA: DUF1844 domain-containing protein [Polyangiaceae bacterium]|jgi:hypothetical protein|nr:DUF1844 domain-containing protein [Polyangiaceae bacterium]